MLGKLRHFAIACALGASSVVCADEAIEAEQLALHDHYPLGVEKYRLDHATQVTGWQIANSWYFGKQKGEDSGLTLVWQGDREQFSVSKDGLRFTRRF
ncbi:MAG: hypothetical protein O7C67_04430 [Gammaproteobacteria bacterium]|nr:hypothetical protein [Gammaproteobacteria bacterium]